MSCVSYNTPPLNHKNAAEFNLYLKAFDENMRLAGLIRNNIPEGATYNDSFGAQPIFDYNYNAFEPFYSTLTVKQTSYWYNTQYLCSMEYKLPIGNGKIIFADDPAYPGYKKINQASYESTEVIIRFNFVLNSGVQSNVSNTLNQRYILCYPTIYTKAYFAIATPGTGYSFHPHAGAGSYNFEMTMEGKSYISLTQNHLTVAVGCHFLGGTMYGNYGRNNFRRYMINFSLYRKDGDIYIYGINGGATDNNYGSDVYYDDRSDIVLWSYNKQNNKTTSWYNRDGKFLYWPIGTAIPAQSKDYYINGKTYGINDKQGLCHIPELITTRIMETNTRPIECVYRINNNLVVGKYMNLGLTERAQCPIDRYTKNYSWAFLYDETTNFTTNNL